MVILNCLVSEWCSTLCNFMDNSLPASSIHGIPQARILEWFAIPSLGDVSNPGIEPTSLVSPTFANPAFAGRFFTNVPLK